MIDKELRDGKNNMTVKQMVLTVMYFLTYNNYAG